MLARTTGVYDGHRRFDAGELGSRGTPELREEEAERAGEILGISVRENLGIPDGNIENTPENRLKVIRAIRRHRPHIALVGAMEDRHPDHPAATELTLSALFYAGLRMIETFEDDGTPQEPCRPNHTLHYMQSTPIEPTLVVDVSEVWEQRTQALLAYSSQFFNPDYNPTEDEPETFISNPDFFEWVEARARSFGYLIGAKYGEPLLYHQGPFGVSDLVATFEREVAFR